MRPVFSTHRRWILLEAALIAILVFCPAALPQPPKPKSTPSAPPEVPTDALGRTTPRGTVLGFLSAARKEDYELAAQYLNTRQRGQAAAVLAEQLSFVLDHRLPARLNELSNEPEGSPSTSLASGRESVGTITSLNGNVDVLLDRVDRGKSGRVWLFSGQTLADVPDLYEEVNAISVANVLPAILMRKFFGFMLYGWLCLFVGVPLLYIFMALISRLLGAVAGWALRRLRRKPDRPTPVFLPAAIRLLIVAVAIRWSLSKLSLPLLSRQFWNTLSILIAITGCVWLFIRVTRRGELYLKRRLERQRSTGAMSLIGPARTALNLAIMIAGLLLGLYCAGVNPSATLAGLGVGGIAVALAAQKTLENIIGGASLILDKAVRVGEFFKVGDTTGTVEEVGLRSTRLRTLDDTVVTIPNGQVAVMKLENFSSRRRFWFHHVVALPYETTSSGMCDMLDTVRNLLEQNSRVIRDSGRVRFFRFGPSSVDVEVASYISARDWPEFLEVQEDLLLHIVDAMHGAASTSVAASGARTP